MVASKISARKSKGREFQKWLVEELRTMTSLDQQAVSCYEGDIQAMLMGGSGVDIKLSPKAKEIIPFDIEAKRQESWNVHKWYSQAKANTTPGRMPLVVAKRNNKEALAIISWENLKTIMR